MPTSPSETPSFKLFEAELLGDFLRIAIGSATTASGNESLAAA